MTTNTQPGNFKDGLIILFKMVTSWKFLIALASSLYLYFTGDVAGMSAVIIGYIGIKAVINASAAMSEGDFEYPWTGDTGIDNFLGKLLSTKTWLAALGIGLAWHLGNADVVKNLIITWVTGQGFTEAAVFLNGVDFSKIIKNKPKENIIPAAIQNINSNTVVPSNQTIPATGTNIIIPTPVVVTKPEPQKPAYQTVAGQVSATSGIVPGDETAKPLELPSIPTAFINGKWDWEAFKKKVKYDVDAENAADLNKSIGNPKLWFTSEQAASRRPELSSNNPAMVWSKTQSRLMDTVGGFVNSNEEAIMAYENALLPAAEAACQNAIDISSGKECDWPASPMCKEWRRWCQVNIENMKLITSLNVFNFKGYAAWFAGEVATSFVNKATPLYMSRDANGLPIPIYLDVKK